MKYLKQFTMLTMVMLILGSISLAAAGTAQMSIVWDPPTHYAKNSDCLDTSMPITPEDLGLILYTVNYRVKGAGTWESLEVSAPAANITGLNFGTTYEVQIGARFPGGNVLCYTVVSEGTTPVKPEPGNCSNVQITTGY